MQMPEILSGLGQAQYGISDAQRQYGLQQFMAGAPEADPRLGFIGPAFTSAYDTAVQQGQFSSGLGSQLLGPAATLGAAKIAFGCVVEGTIIDGKDSKKAIEDIRAGDVIYDKDSNLTVVMWKYEFNEQSSVDKYIELTFENKVKIVLSDTHKIDGVPAKNLTIGENGLVSKKYVPMANRSYDILTEGRDGSYRSNGIGIDSMIPELHKKIQQD